MRTTTLFGTIATLTVACTSASAMHMTAMPRAESTTSADPWQCATENITSFFNVPKPTGSLEEAIGSYGDSLVKPCMSTATLGLLECVATEPSQWCGFTTAAPSTVLSAYSSYGSAASSWWSANRASISSIAEECPVKWENAGIIEHAWLNQTFVHAQCFAERAAVSATASASTTGPSATPGQGSATSSPTSSPTPTNGVVGGAEGIALWMLASMGLVAVTVNSIW